jgi:flagellar protein FlaG
MDTFSITNQTPTRSIASDRLNNTPVLPTKSTVAADIRNPVDRVSAAATTTNEQITKAVENINKTIQAASQNLEFSVDEDSSQVVVKVIDQQTKQVLRQIPTEEVLEIAKSLDKLQGLLIKQTA